jgi:hypothetical protein
MASSFTATRHSVFHVDQQNQVTDPPPQADTRRGPYQRVRLNAWLGGNEFSQDRSNLADIEKARLHLTCVAPIVPEPSR